jgi:hypothetical protein
MYSLILLRFMVNAVGAARIGRIHRPIDNDLAGVASAP